MTDPTNAVKQAFRMLASRHQVLTTQIREADEHLTDLIHTTAPKLLEVVGVGVEVAGQLLVTAGDNPERLKSEAAFAHLCGVAPLPASSGRTDRHASTVAATGAPTTPSTPSCSAAYATTSRPAPTRDDAVHRGWAPKRSCAASNGLRRPRGPQSTDCRP
jgi:transposase